MVWRRRTKGGSIRPCPTSDKWRRRRKGQRLSLTRHGQASYGAFIYMEDRPSGSVISRMNDADGFRGWDLFLSEGRPTVHIIDQYPDKALKITANDAA